MDLTVLIAEDEPKLRAVLCDYFKSRGDTPVSAGDGATALMLAEHGDFDAVLLDVMMPGLDGFAVCRALRRQSAVPILFLTALGDEEDQIRGFALGADDYITKPFSLPVLHAKVSALVARSRGGAAAGAGDILTCGPIAVRLTTRRVTVEGREIALTPKEFDLLVCLMRSPGLVMSREQLLVKCWGSDYEGEARAVDTHIRRLRDKLGSAAGCITTVIKAGYKLEV